MADRPRSGTSYVESPPHVDPKRIRHLPTADLLAGFGDGNAATLTRAADDHGLSEEVTRLRAQWVRGVRPRPVRDITRWAASAPLADTTAAVAEADTLLRQGPVDFLDGSVGRSRLYGLHYLDGLTCLLQAHRVTGLQSYAAAFAENFERWYASRDSVRGEWPGLDVVWYSLGVAARSRPVGQALLELADSPAVNDQVWLHLLATQVGSARWLAEEHTSFRHGNWQFGAACALLQVAALLPDHAEAAGWQAVARARIEEHLALDVYADGGHYERAPSYHALCLSAVQDAAIAARELGWALAEEPVVANMHDWLVDMTTPGGWVPPFNDSQIVWTGDHLVVGHHVLRRPDYKTLVERWVPPERVMSILAGLPPRAGGSDPASDFLAAAGAEPTAAPSRWLAGSRFAVYRTGWSPTDLHVAVNCGPLIEHELESHSHLSALDFVLVAGDTPLVWEAGGPATYDDPLYQTWYRSPRAHSSVWLEGRTLDDEHQADLDLHMAMPVIDAFEAHHDGWTRRHRRRILMVHVPDSMPYLVLDDTVEGSDLMVWNLMSPEPWEASGNDRFRAGSRPGLMVVGSHPSRLAASFLGEGPASYPDAATRGRQYRSAYSLERHVRSDRVRTVLLPFAGEEPTVRVSTGSGDEFVVTLDQAEDRFDAQQWVRSRDGAPVAGAAWGGAALTSLGRLLAGGERVSEIGVHWGDSWVEAHVRTTGRTNLRLSVPGPGEIAIQGVRTGQTVVSGEASVPLSAAGNWVIQVGGDVGARTSARASR